MIHAKAAGERSLPHRRRRRDVAADERSERHGVVLQPGALRSDRSRITSSQLNAQSRESFDGGKTWTHFAAGGVHSDHHALWINPDDPDHMILGNDGGLYTTCDRGRTWDHTENIVAAQFYAVAVDDAQPFYNVYGGLQDNQHVGRPEPHAQQRLVRRTPTGSA